MLCSTSVVNANYVNEHTHIKGENVPYTSAYSSANFDTIYDFDISVVIANGLTDVEGYINWENKAMVNIDHLLKHINYPSNVNEYASVVTAKIDENLVTFIAGTNQVIVNSTVHNLGSTIISDGRALYAPAREVLNLFGYECLFNVHTKNLVVKGSYTDSVLQSYYYQDINLNTADYIPGYNENWSTEVGN